MTEAQRVLIDLVKKSLFNFEIEIPTDVDWQAVYDEANFQSVIPLAFDGTAGIENIPQDVFKKFKNHTVAVMLSNDNVVKAQESLVKLLEENSIDYAILKGLSVAEYYPKPELRTLGDIDFLVSKEDFENTKQLLEDNGYTLIMKENSYHCEFKKGDVVVEPHFEISDFPDTEIGNGLKEELETATKYVEQTGFDKTFNSLDTKHQAISLLLHTERHLIADGIGLRQLLDFGLFSYKNPNLFENIEIVKFLKKYGFYKLATVCDDLFKKYFLGQNVENVTADMLFEMALKKGNFGTKRSKEETYSNFDLEKESGNVFLKYFNYFKKRARHNWALSRKYPWLQNLGFIYLPIRHIFRTIFKGKRIDYKKVVDSNKEMETLYNQLKIFKR